MTKLETETRLDFRLSCLARNASVQKGLAVHVKDIHGERDIYYSHRSSLDNFLRLAKDVPHCQVTPITVLPHTL